MPVTIAEEFHQETIDYLRKTDFSYRKKLGQFFTPRHLREALLNKLPKLEKPKVLDPGCGTGEFLISAKEYFKEPILYGWEIDKKLVEIAKKLVPEAQIELTDALKKDYNEEFDIVIGNPPYFEFKPNKEIRNKFKEILKGRANIYALFIYLGIKLLKKGGYLAYVLSPSMNNGAYFSKLREFIIKNGNIEYLHILEGDFFEGVLQKVMLFIFKKGENKGDYLFKKDDILIFTENPEFLKKAFSGKTTLKSLGYRVQTGKIVWNQYKNLLTDNPKEGVCLIWSHNITPLGLKLNNKKKPQYIKMKYYDVGPAIAVNRVIGKPKNGTLKACLIPPHFKFLAENHVNIIYPPRRANLKEIKDIVNQLNSKEKRELLSYITGNTQISKNELEKLFPIEINKNE